MSSLKLPRGTTACTSHVYCTTCSILALRPRGVGAESYSLSSAGKVTFVPSAARPLYAPASVCSPIDANTHQSVRTR